MILSILFCFVFLVLIFDNTVLGCPCVKTLFLCLCGPDGHDADTFWELIDYAYWRQDRQLPNESHKTPQLLKLCTKTCSYMA
jgi:hypothetical protein